MVFVIPYIYNTKHCFYGSQRVSDIIVYSKEEANRLRSRHIGPEHLLLGLLRDGEGKAIEILSKLNTNLAAVKQQIEARLKTEADDMLLPDAEIPLSNDAAKIFVSDPKRKKQYGCFRARS